MINSKNTLSFALSGVLLYGFFVSMTPILLMGLNVHSAHSQPSIFGFALYKLKLHEHSFSIELTVLGMLLSAAVSVLLYFLFQYLWTKGKEKEQ